MGVYKARSEFHLLRSSFGQKRPPLLAPGVTRSPKFVQPFDAGAAKPLVGQVFDVLIRQHPVLLALPRRAKPEVMLQILGSGLP